VCSCALAIVHGEKEKKDNGWSAERKSGPDEKVVGIMMASSV
jgi:hypothetical protein